MWHEEHGKEAGPALGGGFPSGWAHLKEALTTLPLMGCGGRQFPTRGTGGSFSALDRRLRSLAICRAKEGGQLHVRPSAHTMRATELETHGFQTRSANTAPASHARSRAGG